MEIDRNNKLKIKVEKKEKKPQKIVIVTQIVIMDDSGQPLDKSGTCSTVLTSLLTFYFYSYFSYFISISISIFIYLFFPLFISNFIFY